MGNLNPLFTLTLTRSFLQDVTRGLDPRNPSLAKEIVPKRDGLPGTAERKRRRSSNGYARQ
jgi:hypothetical protein